MQQSTNSFGKGMITDLHPISTNNQVYTDALNATFITYNGNEFAIQNDMGNTKIQDSKTGNIMGLREGFIPVGLKEHGGIMYIASVNNKGEGELGVIPSPVILYNQKSDIYNFITPSGNNFSIDPSGKSELIKMTDELIKSGEKMIIAIESFGNFIKQFKSLDFNEIGYNLISENINLIATNTLSGIFEVKLYSQSSDQVYDISDTIDPSKIKYPLTNGNSYNNTWYYTGNINDIDLNNCLVQENSGTSTAFIKYPNIPSGYPSIRLELNNIENFSLLPNYTSDSSGLREYPFTTMKDDGDYILHILGFKYDSYHGVQVTKVEYNITDDNQTKSFSLTIDISENNSSCRVKHDSRYYILPLPGVTNDFKYLEQSSELSVINNTINNHPEKTFNIGKNSNIWFTLTANYYYEDFKLGTYTCRFNPYVFDVLNIFKTTSLEAQIDYNGFGQEWFTQYYDINSPFDSNIVGKSINITSFNLGGTSLYPDPSGMGISLYKEGYTINGEENYWNLPQHAIILSKENTGEFYRSLYDGLTNSNSTQKFKRPGLTSKLIFDTDFDKINNELYKWPDSTLNNYSYLYKEKPLKSFINTNLSLSYNLNNLGFRTDAVETANKSKDDLLNCLLQYVIFPSLDSSLKRVFDLDISDDYGSVTILKFSDGTQLSGNIISTDIDQIKKFIPENSTDFNIPVLCYLSGEKKVGTSYDSTVYLSGDPWMSKHKYCNDSNFEMNLSFLTQLSATYMSNYEVIPQVNIISKGDGTTYPGYYSELNGIVYDIDVDYTKNYLLQNNMSEGRYDFTTNFLEETETSILGLGFGKLYTNVGTHLLNIKLEKDNSYVYNLNSTVLEYYDLTIKFEFMGTSSSVTPIVGCSIQENCIIFTPDKTNVVKMMRFKLDDTITITSISFSTNRNNILTIPFYSMGLYKDLSLSTSPDIKLQSVYRYSENGKVCFDKTYTYSGGAPCCGYLYLAGTYNSNSSTFTLGNNSITIRKCLV